MWPTVAKGNETLQCSPEMKGYLDGDNSGSRFLCMRHVPLGVISICFSEPFTEKNSGANRAAVWFDWKLKMSQNRDIINVLLQNVQMLFRFTMRDDHLIHKDVSSSTLAAHRIPCFLLQVCLEIANIWACRSVVMHTDTTFVNRHIHEVCPSQQPIQTDSLCIKFNYKVRKQAVRLSVYWSLLIMIE